MLTDKSKGFLALLVTAITFSTFGVLIRELATMFSVYGQVAARSFAAVVILSVLILFSRISLIVPKQYRWKLFWFALSFPIAIILFTISATQTKASNSVFMLYVGTIITSLLIGTIVFKEKFTKQKNIAILIVLVGLGFFVYPFNFNLLNPGLYFGLASGVFDGISNGLRKPLAGLRREVLLFYQYGLGALLSLGLGIWLQTTGGSQLVTSYNPNTVAIAVIYGFGLIFIGSLLLYGFSHFDVNVGTIVLACELLFSLIVNYFILREVPSAQELIGGLLIFLAACVVGIDFRKLLNRAKTN